METAPRIESSDKRTNSSDMTPWLGSQLQKIIDGIYEKYRDVDDGAVATYIP